MAQSVPPDSGLAPEGINSTTSVGKVNDAADKTVSQNAGGYDPELADRAVRLDRLLKDKRFWSSLHTLLALVSAAALDTLVRDRLGKGKNATVSEKRKRRAKRVKQALLELGATFIKLGQFLSVRNDIISEELAEELSSLQDRVPPFGIDVLRNIIERELGAPPEKLFKEFEITPIASASIGQAHRARLQDGRPVVVKVQRPDLAEVFYQDLGYMRFIAKIGPILRPSSDWDAWMALTAEFGRTLFEEIDYLKEGRNADKIRQILKGEKSVRIPRVYWKLTGRRVLTLEYLPGTKINQVEEIKKQGIDPVAIGNNLVAAYMEQVLTAGFFHADPHAGNLAIGPDGRIVIYDFGMVGEISQTQRESILGCIASVINFNAVELIKNLVSLGIVKEDAKHESMIRAVQPFIEYYKGKQVKELDFTSLEHDIDQIAMDRALKLPPSLAYLLRTASTLEGIARSLHPNFSFVEAAKPSVKKWALANPAQAYLALGYLTQGKLFGQRGIFSEEGVLRLFQTKSQETTGATDRKGTARSKTDNQADSVTSTSTTLSTVRSLKGAPPKISQVNSALEQSERELSFRLQEIRKLEAHLYILKREVKTLRKNRVKLLVTILAASTLSLSYWSLTPRTGSPQYSEFFLIGNGVMVAIIIWQLVRPPDLASRKQADRSRGRRR